MPIVGLRFNQPAREDWVDPYREKCSLLEAEANKQQPRLCLRHEVPTAQRARMGDPARLGGRPVRQEQAQGILIAALGVLAVRSGYAADAHAVHTRY
jgi:hypothetical protein